MIESLEILTELIEKSNDGSLQSAFRDFMIKFNEEMQLYGSLVESIKFLENMPELPMMPTVEPEVNEFQSFRFKRKGVS